MIEDVYVSFETAKLLKDKKFNEATIGIYNKDGSFEILTNNHWNELFITPICAPTQAMTMKWLREIHKICIVVYPFTHRERGTYTSDICTTTMTMEEGHLRGIWNTYEEAVEESIKYCLTNLIK